MNINQHYYYSINILQFSLIYLIKEFLHKIPFYYQYLLNLFLFLLYTNFLTKMFNLFKGVVIFIFYGQVLSQFA